MNAYEDRLFASFVGLADVCVAAGLSESGFVRVFVSMCEQLAREDVEARTYLVLNGAQMQADLWRLEGDGSRFRSIPAPVGAADVLATGGGVR